MVDLNERKNGVWGTERGDRANIEYMGLNPKQPKVFGVKFSLREIERIFSIKIRNFKL